jgi:hypothetical protein
MIPELQGLSLPDLSQAFLGALLGIGSALGSLFGAGAKASSDSRLSEAGLNVARDRNALDAYQTQQNAQMQQGQLDLQRKGFTDDARGLRAKQALIGNLLSTLKPTQVSVPGITPAQINSGLTVGADGQQALANLVKQALAAQMAGDTFQGGSILKPPAQTPIPKAGLLEKILGVGGLIGSGMGAVAPFLPQPRPKLPEDPYNNEGNYE